MISETVLVLAGPFGEHLEADRVAAALGHGLRTGGRLQCDLCPLEDETGTTARKAGKLLDELYFDRRMRAVRAVVIAQERLDDHTLAGSVTFEAATRARQTGVPAYAVTAHDELDLFEARIIDLQLVLKAGTPRLLRAAGRRLAMLV